MKLREVLKRSGIGPWMTTQLNDPRCMVELTHDLAPLARASLLLSVHGCCKQNFGNVTPFQQWVHSATY